LCWGAKPRYVKLTVGTKVPWNESSWERKFHVTFAPGNESSRERKFREAKFPSMELSFPAAEIRGNESSIIRHGLDFGCLHQRQFLPQR